MAIEYRFFCMGMFDTEIERDKAYDAFKTAIFDSVMNSAIFKDLVLSKAAVDDLSDNNVENLVSLADEKQKKIK